MRLLRVLVWWFGLMLALAPLSAAFASTASDHAQEEVVNAEAELQAAQQEAADFAAQAAQEAANARAIAFLKSETLRELQLTNTANATAVQQLASGLADAIRSQGDAKARNEMAILQIKANALIVKADGRLTNALAMGRSDEIANAQAQSEALHQVADYLTGALAQQNMTNAEVIAEHDAAALEVSATVEAQNADAMGADELFAADSILEGASLDVTSAMIAGDAQGEAIVAHALVELANAEAIAALKAP